MVFYHHIRNFKLLEPEWSPFWSSILFLIEIFRQGKAWLEDATFPFVTIWYKAVDAHFCFPLKACLVIKWFCPHGADFIFKMNIEITWIPSKVFGRKGTKSRHTFVADIRVFINRLFPDYPIIKVLSKLTNIANCLYFRLTLLVKDIDSYCQNCT